MIDKLSQFEPGIKYNKLTILKFSHKDNKYRKFYLCKCDCGNITIVQGHLLKNGNTKSCGCYGKEYRNRSPFKLDNNKGAINQLILQYKRHARNRNIKFELTDDEFTDIIQKPCHYCGIKPSNKLKNRCCKSGFLYSGIDRINSSIGYKSSNCVPCCVMCNKSKGNKSVSEFINWINRVYKHSCNID